MSEIMPEKRITFCTAFYPIQSKFPSEKYIEWATNLFSIVNQFYLVVFTEENTKKTLLNIKGQNQNICIIVRPFSDFHVIKYIDFWKKIPLLENTSWELNMLWNEKVWMVSDIIETRYFPETEYYGWVDIGYFRNEIDNIHTNYLSNWANYEKLVLFSQDKVHYALINPLGYNLLKELRKNGYGIPYLQVSVGGGFFFGGKKALLKWRDIFTVKLEEYVSKGSMLCSDQIIIIHCLLEIGENDPVVLHVASQQECYCIICKYAIMQYKSCRKDMTTMVLRNCFPVTCCHTKGINDWFLFQSLLK